MTTSPVTRCLSATDFAAPSADRWFEDYVPGLAFEYGSVTVTEPEILEFARRYDPQTMHVDPSLAAAGPFGGLIASGWQTVAIAMRLYVDHYHPRRQPRLAGCRRGALDGPGPPR